MVVETDVLDFIFGVYLLQKHQDGQYLVVYYSRKITLLELNYNIYNKELLGIVIGVESIFIRYRETIYS